MEWALNATKYVADSGQRGWTPRRHRRGGTRSNESRRNALERIRQSTRRSHRCAGLRRWRCHRRAQRAVHPGMNLFRSAAILILDQHLHDASASTNQKNSLCSDDRCGQSNAERQDKPRQHKAREHGESSQGLHRAHYVSICLHFRDCKNLLLSCVNSKHQNHKRRSANP